MKGESGRRMDRERGEVVVCWSGEEHEDLLRKQIGWRRWWWEEKEGQIEINERSNEIEHNEGRDTNYPGGSGERERLVILSM